MLRRLYLTVLLAVVSWLKLLSLSPLCEKLHVVVYNILPLEEGARKRRLECEQRPLCVAAGNN